MHSLKASPWIRKAVEKDVLVIPKYKCMRDCASKYLRTCAGVLTVVIIKSALVAESLELEFPIVETGTAYWWIIQCAKLFATRYHSAESRDYKSNGSVIIEDCLSESHCKNAVINFYCFLSKGDLHKKHSTVNFIVCQSKGE